MKTVIVDVTPDFLAQSLHDLRLVGLHVVGSDESEVDQTIRLVMSGKDIPAEFDGQRVILIVHQSQDVLSFSMNLSFEAVK